jgi:L-aminopeptidase/D-esterase-like protein
MTTGEPNQLAHDDICDVPGVLLGHDTDLDAATGCTVLRFVTAALGAVDVRGGAPATRETELLDPLCMMDQVHALVLTGGSAFGLDAASGVARLLEREGVGFDTGVARVPIVPAAALFDLGIGRADVRPDADSGERAASAATRQVVQQGTVGAGTGATVGKLAGPSLAMKSGLGSASARTPDGFVVGALVAVNAVGDMYDPESGQIVAGARSPLGSGWLATERALTDLSAETPQSPSPFHGAHTTLAAVATDAPFSKAGLAKIAQMAHDGLARAIRPVHTPFDGDIVFAISTAARPAPDGDSRQIALVGALAADTLARAVLKAARLATTLHDVPAARDL